MFAVALWCTLDSPPVADTDHWKFIVTDEFIRHAIQAANRHVVWLESNRRDDFHWIDEAKWRRDVWALLGEIRENANVRNKVIWRMEKLGQLRVMIGPDAYDDFEMPDYLPMWRFRERNSWER